MRVERVENSWQRAGWTQKPRNSREWKLLKAGKPQPVKREQPAFRCRKFSSHTVYKTVYSDGREVRVCTVCRNRSRAKHYEKNRSKYNKYSQAHKQKLREFVPVLEEGYYTISLSWLAKYPSKVVELLKDGQVIVEMFGDPVFEIRSYGSV